MCCAVGGFPDTTSPTADNNELPHGAYGRGVKTETILRSSDGVSQLTGDARLVPDAILPQT